MVTKTIPIQTKNLILRKITIEDAQPMYKNWASDDDVTKYLNWQTHRNINVTKDIIMTWIHQYNNDFFFQWIIEHIQNKEVIGTISLFNYRDNSLEVGYCISKKYWNQGLTTEACSAVLDFAFNKIGVDKVYARHVRENEASGRVMQKNNMTFINTTIEYIAAKNKRVYMNHYIIKKEDFK